MQLLQNEHAGFFWANDTCVPAKASVAEVVYK